jgi:hypothetical protein
VSEPADPPPDVVSGRHSDVVPGRHSDVVPGRHSADPAADPAPPPEPEPPLSLRPPNARPAPEPLEADVVRIVIVGTSLWFAAFLVLLPFRDRLAADGRGFWLWTCLAGGLLGLVGLLLARRAAARRAATRRAAASRRDAPAG